MKILPTFDPETIKQAITTDFPDLAIETIKLIDNSWDNIVALVNNTYVFRFPKDDEACSDTEIKVLNTLQDKITLPIPKIEYIGASFTYMGYRNIPGTTLTPTVLDSLNTQHRTKLVFDLANFLREIHTVISPDAAKALGVPNEDLAYNVQSICATLRDKIKTESVLDFINVTVEAYRQIISTPEDTVFLYSDLHPNNIAFDIERNQANGIFDFGDIAVGDIHLDFYPLYIFDSTLMEEVAEKYQELTDRTLDLQRIAAYGRMYELSDLAEYADQPESDVYKNAMNRIEHWINEPLPL